MESKTSKFHEIVAYQQLKLIQDQNGYTTWQNSEMAEKSLWLLSRRNVIALFIFFGYLNMFSLRSNMSVAVVDMTSNKAYKLDNGTMINRKEFHWNSKEQSVILSAFFYGYLSFLLFGGWLATRYGGVKMFGFGLFMAGVVTILIPLGALTPWPMYSFVALRIIEGVFQAISFSSMQEIWSNWFPSNEMSKLSSFTFTGTYVGSAVAFSISGIAAKTWGWSWIFYITGALDVIWSILWFICVTESPTTDPWISKNELEYLNKSIKQRSKQVSYPWLKIFTSKAVLAFCIVRFVQGWSLTFLRTYMPFYIKGILNFNIGTVGLISALPPCIIVFSLTVIGQLKDIIRRKNILSRTTENKIFVSVGFLFSAISLIFAGFLHQPVLCVFMILVYAFANCFIIVILNLNPLELSPAYPSIVAGIGNTFFTISQILSPTLIGFLVVSNNIAEWRIVFITASIVYMIGLFCYYCFGSGIEQKWAKQETNIVCITSQKFNP